MVPVEADDVGRVADQLQRGRSIEDELVAVAVDDGHEVAVPVDLDQSAGVRRAGLPSATPSHWPWESA